MIFLDYHNIGMKFLLLLMTINFCRKIYWRHKMDSLLSTECVQYAWAINRNFDHMLKRTKTLNTETNLLLLLKCISSSALYMILSLKHFDHMFKGTKTLTTTSTRPIEPPNLVQESALTSSSFNTLSIAVVGRSNHNPPYQIQR
jgi:hypothetical protein